MNEQLIINMAKPFVKDGYLTFEQFDAIYDMLPRREQYQVVDVLSCHGIELIGKIAPLAALARQNSPTLTEF